MTIKTITGTVDDELIVRIKEQFKAMRALLLLLFSTQAMAANWWSNNPTTNSLMLASNIAIIADWAQTREIADNDSYYEKNSYLGAHPKSGEVNAFFISSLLAHNIIGSLLPQKYRPYYYGSQLGFRIGVVKDNAEIGIKFKF